MPQLAPSAMVLAQPFAQAVSPAWHMQVPAHTCPALHATLHALQWATSVAVLEQACPQAKSGGGQLHVPLTQLCVEPQALPHAPQLAASVLGFTQAPPHGAVPTGHCPLPPTAAPPPPSVDMPPAPLLALPPLPTMTPLLGALGAGEQLSAIKPPAAAHAPTRSTRNQRWAWESMICGISST
jgi:hypothetical protein